MRHLNRLRRMDEVWATNGIDDDRRGPPAKLLLLLLSGASHPQPEEAGKEGEKRGG